LHTALDDGVFYTEEFGDSGLEHFSLPCEKNRDVSTVML
jgi:hypothetical protein